MEGHPSGFILLLNQKAFYVDFFQTDHLRNNNIS